MMKRFLTLMIALLLVLCAIPMAASAEERPTLTILMAQDTYVEDYETNAFTKFIEDSMNVNLDFVLLPASDASDKLAVMIQSGQELPGHHQLLPRRDHDLPLCAGRRDHSAERLL